jgi:hypothetical protein
MALARVHVVGGPAAIDRPADGLAYWLDDAIRCVRGVSPPAGARRVVAHALLLVVVFVLLAGPWLQSIWTAVPLDDASEDAWLIVRVLDWVRHALATAPSTLFDPPINFPRPASSPARSTSSGARCCSRRFAGSRAARWRRRT